VVNYAQKQMHMGEIVKLLSLLTSTKNRGELLAERS